VDELGVEPGEALKAAAAMTRDKNRTPMQWTGEANAGFCPPGVKPWLPVNPDHARGVNVAAQQADPDSLLHFYRRMLRMRRASAALRAGDYLPLPERSQEVLAFLRRTPAETVLVALNFSAAPGRADFPELASRRPRLLFRSGPEQPVSPGAVPLATFEACILALE
jgi:alpha-glucosidase